jgi:hypothetical protein
MAGSQAQTDKTRYETSKLKSKLKCLQINLQHSRAATDNISKIIHEEGTDIVFIQEPYNVTNKPVCLPRSCAVFTSGPGRKRAAIVVMNKKIDTLLLTQLSNEDTVVVEAKVDRVSLILVSMYFDFNRPIDIDLQKILTHAKGTGIIFAIDSNARSTTWHDVITNKRGKALEEFLISRQLYTANEESCYKSFNQEEAQVI